MRPIVGRATIVRMRGAGMHLVRSVLQNFTTAEGFASPLNAEKSYPFYFEFLTRAA
jgi:hypothetical protein